ncbi:MAG: hypothetical protein WA842_03390 [Croceibacterium sp.]
MRKFIIAAPLALAAAIAVASPASAASFNNPGQIRSEINQLDRRIDQLQRGPGISGREAQKLERQVDQLHDLYARYARGGFTRGELNTLGARVDAVRAQLRAERFDHNDHRGQEQHRDRDHDRYYRR